MLHILFSILISLGSVSAYTTNTNKITKEHVDSQERNIIYLDTGEDTTGW